MESELFLIIHSENNITLGQPNGGSEMASLYLAEALAESGKNVVLAAPLIGSERKDKNLELWDLGEDYNVTEILKRASKAGPYNLISKHSIPIVLSKSDQNCLSRSLLVDAPGGSTGLKLEVISKIVDAIVCVSTPLRHRTISEGANPIKTTVVHNGVCLDLFKPDERVQRKKYNLVFAGALVPDKGIHFLVEAYSNLKTQFPELTLDVYGSASLWNRTDFIEPKEIEKAFPGIKFHGKVGPEQLATAYQQATLCIVPSIWFEAFGMVASDALATGCPVVTFDVGGTAEIVIHDENGIVIKEITSKALTAGIESLLKNPAKIASLQEGALKHCKRFDWNKSAETFAELIERIKLRKPQPIEQKNKQVPISKNLPSGLPKISVVTVSYNQGQFIRDNIESVLKQGYDNFEHIIIDGGSTDSTLDVLKEYDHLDWISEKDRGQSHALNKGFKKASGDIIVWLNSDDWLEPDCFRKIVPALKEKRTVIAPANHTDKTGNIIEVISNCKRDYEDLLKFWVPYAWFAQVSIFFTRDLLNEVRLQNGDFIDEDLHYVMDIDLWMRMALQEGFYNRIDHTCANFRMYEDNKTGANGLAAQKECSRLFRRYCNQGFTPERRFSVILPIKEIDSELTDTIYSLLSQELSDIEVILVGYSGGVSKSAVRKFAEELSPKLPSFCIRPFVSNSNNLLEAFNFGIENLTGHYTVLMQPGDRLGPNFLTEMEKTFVFDWVGLCLPLANDHEMKKQLSTDSEQGQLTITGLLSTSIQSPTLAARSATLKQLGGFKNCKDNAYGIKELILRTLHQSWHVLIDRPMSVDLKKTNIDSCEISEQEHQLEIAKLVANLTEEADNSPFFEVKVAHGNAIVFSEDLVQQARFLLSSANSTSLEA